MPDTHHDKRHKGDCSVLTKNIDQDLQNRLFDFACHSALKVLDREEKGNEEEETENSRASNRHQNTNRSIPRGIVCLFRKMGRSIKTSNPVNRSMVSPNLKVSPERDTVGLVGHCQISISSHWGK